MKILVVEDDPLLRDGLADLLQGAGHVVVMVSDGFTAAKRGLDPELELILLDVMLPKLDGIEVCHRLRKARPDLPILMLTAKGSEEDKVRGLKVGADDYVTKPFGARELLARIDALMRRRSPSSVKTKLAVGDLELDLLTRAATRSGQAIDLQPREFRLLEYLMRHAGQVVTRTMLLESVWEYHFDPQTNVIDVHISRLRQKIDKGFNPPLLHTVRGAGYCIRADN